LRRSESATEVSGSRMKRLAQSIEALADKDGELLRMSRQMEQVRRNAACELHTICRDFVNSLNRLTSKVELTLDPDRFSDASFQEDAVNLIQINVRGRILQVGFGATQELVSLTPWPGLYAPSIRTC
jgi:hypothetical protein